MTNVSFRRMIAFIFRESWTHGGWKLPVFIALTAIVAVTMVVEPILRGKLAAAVASGSVPGWKMSFELLIVLSLAALAVPSVTFPLMTFLTSRTAFDVNTGMDIRFKERCGSTPYSVSEGPERQNQMSFVFENLYRVWQGCNAFLESVSSSLIVCIAIVAVFKLSWVTAILILASLVPTYLLQAWIARMRQKTQAEVTPIRRRFWATSQQFLRVELILPLKLLDLGRTFAVNLRTWAGMIQGRTAATEQKILLWLFPAQLVTEVTITVILLVIGRAAFYRETSFLTGSQPCNLELWVTLAAVIGVLRTAAGSFIAAQGRLKEHQAFISTLVEFFDGPSGEAGGTHPAPPATETMRVEFRNVWFRYSKARKKWTLKNVSFVVEGGDTIALLGDNGAGKSTICKLLCGLYRPERGSILLNGVDTNDLSADDRMRLLGIMPQGVPDYRGFRIDEAIALGDSSRPFDVAKAIEAARAVGADRFIEKLPLGYATRIGRDHGTPDNEALEPSGGQRQLMFLAMQFYRSSRIVLLDEPTAAVDYTGKLRIRDSLKQFRGKRTLILATHDPLIIRGVQTVVVLRRGRVLQYGKATELRRVKGWYRTFISVHRL